MGGHNGRVPPEGSVHVVVLDRGRELSGVVHDGESWAAAARRTCASMHTEPEPVDLSGEVKRFVVDHDNRLAIRAMTRGDLDDVLAWRASPQVRAGGRRASSATPTRWSRSTPSGSTG